MANVKLIREVKIILELDEEEAKTIRAALQGAVEKGVLFGPQRVVAEQIDDALPVWAETNQAVISLPAQGASRCESRGGPRL